MGKLRQKGSGGQIMLEKVDLTMKMEKSEYKAKMTALKLQMGKLQRQCKEMGLPIMIVFEGFDAAGKGMQIGKLIQSLDPRGFEVFTVKEETKEEAMHPFLWRFWTKTPQRGRMAVYDGSWYIKVLSDRFEKKMRESEIENCYRSICSFEKQITEDGTLLIKLFLDIDQKEQKKRFDKLMESKDTAWRVTKADLKKNEKYDQYQEMIEEMLQRTDTEYAPWTIVEATDRRYATVKIYTVITQMLTAGIDNRRREIARETAAEVIREAEKEASENRSLIDGATKGFQESVLAKVDLSLCCDRKTYRKKLKEYQKKIEKLHGELYQKRIPVVIGFEGWDAAGKGGNIKRITEALDPRGFEVHPIASPEPHEKARHYLWRFWTRLPKDGHIAIFDRTWYGRVMVERLEGFCSENDWRRAYNEINEFEKELSDWGAVIVKFWVHIDKDTQLARFNDRQSNPEKQWKITDEDWRNREKWDQYEMAVDEMLQKTSTVYAPWHILESVDKKYARLKALRIVIEEIEKALK